MLTHTDVHYLAAILTQIASPWGVEIELGDMVEDIAAEKARDVDITARYRLANGDMVEMHGTEVKDEKRPLDVQVVEQIIAKLKDMPALSKHGLVSASGFSEAAVKKARHHGLELFHFRDWDGTGLKVDMRFLFAGATTFRASTWESVQAIPHLDDPPPEGVDPNQRFSFGPDLMVHDPVQPDLKLSFGQLLDQVCNAALNAVDSQNQLDTGEQRRIPVDMPVNLSSPIQIPVFGKMQTIRTIRVVGTAVLTDSSNRRIFKAVVRDVDNAPIAGCMINEWPDGSLMMMMTSSTEGSLTMRGISVEDRGKKKIYKQKLGTIPPDGPPPASQA